MKTKLICLLLVLSLIGSICYAENISTVDSEPAAIITEDTIQSDAGSVPSDGIKSDGKSSENNINIKNDDKKDETEKTSDDSSKESSEYMTRDEYIALLEEKLSMEIARNVYKTYFKLYLESLSAYKYIDSYMVLDEESGMIRPDAKKAIIDLLVTVYDSINVNSQRVTDSEEIREIMNSCNNNAWQELNDNKLQFEFETAVDKFSFEILLTDVGAKTPWGYFRTDKAEQIIADAEAAIYSHKDIFINTREETREVDPETVSVTERLTFDIKLTDEHEKTIFMQFGDIGDVLKCSVENVRINTSDYFIFTISGDKKTESYYTREHVLDFTTGNAGNTLTFYTNSTYDGSVMSYITKEQKKAEFTIGGSTANGKITKAVISVESQGYGRNIENVQGTNANYEFLAEINTMNSVRNMYVLFGLTRENVLKYYSSGGEVQDPERYVTPLRGVYEDGEAVYDFYLPFICHIKPNKTLKSVPSWYKELGDDVEITFIGVTQTLNGKDRLGYTMIRFAGDKGTKWFDNNITQPSINSAEKEYQVYNTYNSMLSFDDFVKVKNTVEYDTTSATLFFNDDENRSFKLIKFKIGNEILEVPESNIKYIGGGKIAYEKLW